MRHRRPASMGLALALAAGVLAAPPAAAGPSPRPGAFPAASTPATAGCGSSVFPLFTFYVEWEPVRTSYRVGQTARVRVNVTRPGEHDPLGEGIPTPRPTTMPAEGVHVGIGVLVGHYGTRGSAVTDENGDALVRIPIERWMKPGPARASVLAQKLFADLPCIQVIEYGSRREDNFFRITP